METTPSQPARSFASDNNAGVHPEILEAIARANQGHVVAYGDDPYTRSAVKKFEEHFGPDIAVFFTFNGTGANVLGLQALTRSFQSVLCSDYAHIYCDECGAPEKHIGCKLIPLPHRDGKITLDSVRHAYHGIGDQHHSQPRVISITQCHGDGHGLPAGGDSGARTVSLTSMTCSCMWTGRASRTPPHRLARRCRQATRDLGVDVLSFGGTKNGILGGEAVVFFRPELACDFLYLRKQSMQLASKMRFIAAQFEALLTNDLWRRSAEHANRMARLLEKEVSRIPEVKIVWKVEANGVFVQIPRARDRKDQAALLFLYVDRGGVHRALDVLLRHHRRRHSQFRQGGCRSREGVTDRAHLLAS